MAEIFGFLILQPLFGVLHACFAILYPVKSANMARLQLWMGATLVVIAVLTISMLFALWHRLSWPWFGSAFIFWFINCHLVNVLADRAEQEAKAVQKKESA